jgi:hypothetical protein
MATTLVAGFMKGWLNLLENVNRGADVFLTEG